ncbi:MAG: sigma-70 family RNA polymerase sigma factor [Phycisphaerae bacterium]|jgi:RNA polymerase sigma-70 factor (ECF subfamily)
MTVQTTSNVRPGSPVQARLLTPEEAELLARLRQGEERAFDDLVRLYGGRMLAVARRLLRCEEDCADAVQDALIAAAQAIGRFEGACRLSTWLHRIVVNVCLMRLRSGVNQPMASIEDLPRALSDPRPHLPRSSAATFDACASAARDEARARVRACIEELPEPYRTVVLLRDIHEFDTEQTARLLGASRANVKTRLHRARRALRPLLEPIFRDVCAPIRAA